MRHKDVELLMFEDIEERRFSRWSMALIKLSDQDPMVKLQHPEFDPYSASGPQAMQQLLHWLDSSQPIERLGD
jgi:formate-dependent nitrite reductase cytochrome c552 subunit